MLPWSGLRRHTKEAKGIRDAYAGFVARGEKETPPDRSLGIAIFSIFLVICGMVAYVLVNAMRPEPPLVVERPHADWRAVLSVVRGRGCTPPSGLAIGVEPDPSGALERELRGRGYVATGAWSEPLAFPLTAGPRGLDGACGLVAVLSEGGVVSAAGTDPASLMPPCRGELATVPVCGNDASVIAQGWGQARTRTFALPGLDQTAAEQTGLPLDALLAHLEAELLLARSGWRASETVWSHEHPAGGAAVLPPSPSSGCEPWVVVGLGVEDASSFFDGELLAHELSPRRFSVPFLRCASPANDLVYDTSRPGHLFWRRYAPGAAPPRIDPPTLVRLPRAVDDPADLVAP